MPKGSEKLEIEILPQVISAGQSTLGWQISWHWLAGNSFSPCGRIFIFSFSETLGINIEGLNSLLLGIQLFVSICFDGVWVFIFTIKNNILFHPTISPLYEKTWELFLGQNNIWEGLLQIRYQKYLFILCSKEQLWRPLKDWISKISVLKLQNQNYHSNWVENL